LVTRLLLKDRAPIKGMRAGLSALGKRPSWNTETSIGGNL